MLNVSVGEGGENLDVTSNHLDIVPVDYTRMADGADGGDEIAKRVENFGRPVGQGQFTRASLNDASVHSSFSTGEPNTNPVLICKIRQGQEIRAKCIAKKVRE